jgi:O-acetyl-ADP-ribose deacetylase (regulator of RNase III)
MSFVIVNNTSIFDYNSQVIVNPVNCVGVMGAGLALEFKKRYPDNFINYKRICDNHSLYMGGFYPYWTGDKNPEYIINFPTKHHYSELSNIEKIEQGLILLNKWMNDMKLSQISIPKIGCGLGGLKWTDVEPLITNAFAVSDIHVNIFIKG